MNTRAENLDLEKKRVLKMFFIDLILIIVFAGIILIGVFLHKTNIITFFGVVEGLLIGFMLLIGAERIEISHMT